MFSQPERPAARPRPALQLRLGQQGEIGGDQAVAEPKGGGSELIEDASAAGGVVAVVVTRRLQLQAPPGDGL